MPSSNTGCKGHQRSCEGGGLIRRGRPALKIPVLLIALQLLSGTSITFAQCEVYESAKLTASDAGPDDRFGTSVSVSGDVALVGAYGKDCSSGDSCGSAYVYRFNGSTWVEEQKLNASDSVLGDFFGGSVSVSEDVVIVGVLNDDCAHGRLCGSAYVYRFNGSTWVQEQKLTSSGPTSGEFFGWSVSISGSVVVVGAPGSGCGISSHCGAAYVFWFNGITWVEEQVLIAPDTAPSGNFGVSVALSGDIVVVGANRTDCALGALCGSAYVYRFNGSTWVEEQKLTASDADVGDRFGWTVSVSDDVAFVGARTDDCGGGSDCGSAYVYRFNGSTWVEEQKLTAMDADVGDRFGWSVSVSGELAIVGAGADDCVNGDNCGSAYVYRFNPGEPRHWVEQIKLSATDAAAGDSFGVSVSVSRDVALFGALGDDCAAGDFCGSAYIYTIGNLPLPTDCNANYIADECDIEEGLSRDADENGIPDECETGACCDHDPFGGCTGGLIRSECDCVRCEWTELTSCEDVECPHDSIPTVTTWGVAILSLLLLTGAKLRFGVRSPLLMTRNS